MASFEKTDIPRSLIPLTLIANRPATKVPFENRLIVLQICIQNSVVFGELFPRLTTVLYLNWHIKDQRCYYNQALVQKFKGLIRAISPPKKHLKSHTGQVLPTTTRSSNECDKGLNTRKVWCMHQVRLKMKCRWYCIDVILLTSVIFSLRVSQQITRDVETCIRCCACE